MHIAENIVLNTYSIIILTIIGTYSYKHDDRKTVLYKLYMAILLITAFMLGADSLGRMDGDKYMLFPFLNSVGNFTLFLSNPFVPSLWLTYVHYHISFDWEKTRKILHLSGIYCGLYTILLIVSIPHGWFYYIDSGNYYHRGPYYMAAVLVTVIPILVAFILILKNREEINPKHYTYLLIFPIPPLICTLMQSMFYGFSLVWNGMAISLIVVFLNIQEHNIYTDYLTNIYNRRKLEEYLNGKIHKSQKNNEAFAVIMLDMNNFKYINDTFGHHSGDEALRISAKLFSSCLRSGDFIGRYGGDEFLCVLGIDNMKDLETLIDRIQKKFKMFNESDRYPFEINFSMGYDLYDLGSRMTALEFVKRIDSLLYKDKIAQKTIS